MFNNNKQVYIIQKPILSKDEYNQEIINWEEVGTERVFIALNSHQQYTTEGLFAQKCEWIGVTSLPSSIDVGYKVGDYEVTFIVDTPRERFLYLSNYGR